MVAIPVPYHCLVFLHSRRPWRDALSYYCLSLTENNIVFTARCIRVQSAVLRSHVVRPPIRLSVCDVGGLWSHRLEFFENNFTVSYRGEFALCRPKHLGSIPRGATGNLGPKLPADLSVGYIRSHWLQIAQRSQWRAYRKPPSLFGLVPSLTPTTSPSGLPPKWGSICPQDTRMAISPQRLIRSTYIAQLSCCP